ncbi:MAG: flagellin FliC [Betaproteobacteria bacterium]|nr:flagellin FliC [Betaproteobacteria bacterium]
MSVINTNVSAMYSQNAMKTNARKMDTAMEQLSTGTRVNSAKDDAAGLAIGQNMTSQIRGLNMAVRNLNDGINMMQTAEGAMIEQSNMLQRMRELAVQANNGTYSNTQRSYLSLEYEALASQITKIASETKWNDQNLLLGTGGSSGTFTYQVGQASGQTINVTISAMYGTVLGLDGGGISTAASASAAIATIGSALEKINVQRAAIGAGINQMEFAADNVTNIASNTTQSRSTIMDTDYALATTQLAKTQIIQQAATAMLAQANQQPQQVMTLLKG